MHRKDLAVDLRLHEGRVRCRKLCADQHGKDAADDKERSGDNQEQGADVIVVAGGKPATKTLIGPPYARKAPV